MDKEGLIGGGLMRFSDIKKYEFVIGYMERVQVNYGVGGKKEKDTGRLFPAQVCL